MHSGRSLSRRAFLGGLATSAAAAILAACGGSSSKGTPTGGAQPTTAAGGGTTAGATPTTTGNQPAVAPNVSSGQGGQGAAGNIPTPRSQTVVGDRLKFQIFDSFNPYIPNGEHQDSGLHQGSRESMFYANFQNGQIIPWLATKWAYNGDFTQLTLSLNPTAMWSDGQPYTADDVLFSLDLLAKNSQFTGSSQVTQYMDSAMATDKSTIVMQLKIPNPRFHYNFISGIYNDVVKVVPKHIWEKQDANTFKFNPPVYTGPYMLDRVIPEQFMFIWKKNPNYWNKANLDPKPQFMVWRQALPPDAEVQEFTRGNVDTPAIDNFDYLNQQAIKDSYKNMIQLNFLDPCPRGVWFNMDSPTGLFQKAEGRQALSYLLDRDQIGKTIWQPPSPAAKYPWASWAANDKWKNDDIQKQYDLTYDPKKAEQLLDSMGATKQGDMRSLNGKPLSLTLITPLPVGKPEYQIAQSLATNAKKVGIDIQVKSLVGTPFNDAYQLGQFDLTSHWLCGSALDPNQLYNKFEGRLYKPVGTRTPANDDETRTRLPEFDAIVAKLNNVDPSDPKNKPLFDQGLNVFMKNLPATPSIQTTYPLAFNTTYWTGWPTQDNIYNVPANWWAQFIFVIGKLQPTGK
jgi:peptide/nickel transport system substrate-binding protein